MNPKPQTLRKRRPFLGCLGGVDSQLCRYRREADLFGSKEPFLRVRALRFEGLGFRVLRFEGLGFRVLGFWFWGLGLGELYVMGA